MKGENQPPLTDELLEFEKQSVQVQDFRIINDHFRGTYRIHLELIKKTERSQHVTGWTRKLGNTKISTEHAQKSLPDTGILMFFWLE